MFRLSRYLPLLTTAMLLLLLMAGLPARFPSARAETILGPDRLAPGLASAQRQANGRPPEAANLQAVATPTANSTWAAQATVSSRQIYLPISLREGPGFQGSVTGRVTHDGLPAAGTLVELRFCTAARCSTASAAITSLDGTYVFTNVLALPSGASYHVSWTNTAADPAFLGFWQGPAITSIGAGQTVSGGNWDIKNVLLSSPPSSATVSLPQVFSWTNRGIATDSYALVFWDLGDSKWASDPLGNVNSVAINTLPATMAPNVSYGWLVRVLADGGYGESYRYRSIRFTSVSAALLFAPPLWSEEHAVRRPANETRPAQ